MSGAAWERPARVLPLPEPWTVKARRPRMGPVSAQALSAAALLTLLTSSQGLLTTASKTSAGGYAYNVATVPFLAECLKLAISAALLRRQMRTTPEAARITAGWRSMLLFPIPSIIYWVHNNVQFYTLQYVDPATYQILGNLKIVTTGLLMRACLRRELSPLQWIALVLLTVGATTSQLKTSCSGGPGGFAAFSAPIQGYAFGALSALLSALAAVYTEWVMKRNADSLHWQNSQLYAFGVLFNGLGLLAGAWRQGWQGGSGLGPGALVAGYSGVTWAVVANLAFSGLLVSWVMKFADSIMKVYATSMAMFVTMAVSIVRFSLAPSLQMLLGMVTATISLVLYYLPPALLTASAPASAQRLPK